MRVDDQQHYRELARALRERREAAKVSLRVLGATSGYDFRHIDEIERGRRPCPGHTFARLMEALDLLIRTSRPADTEA